MSSEKIVEVTKEVEAEVKPAQSSSPIVKRLKYEMCKNWRERGVCKYGDKCLFAHGEKELTKRSTAPEVKPECAEKVKISEEESPKTETELSFETPTKPKEKLISEEKSRETVNTP